ncbi:uncharacterized protein LOC113475293 isoform X1 [Ciona intestinalis]
MGDRGRRSSSSDSASSSEGKKSPNRHQRLNQTRKFRIPSHADAVLQALNHQRTHGEFCDITVLVEHQRFMAHKCVLSASSDYFKGLLSSDNDGVFLRHITAESFRAILDFMYTSHLQLEPGHVQDILTAAKFLQVKGVVSICCRYLESQIKNLSRDLDEYTSRHRDPPLLSIDGQLFKNKDASFPSQPHITYDPATGTFAPDISMVSQPVNISPQKPIFQFQPTTQQLPTYGIPQPAQQAIPVVPMTGATNRYSTNGMQLDPAMSYSLNDPNFASCPPIISNAPVMNPKLQQQPYMSNQLSVPPWTSSKYTPSFYPCQNMKSRRTPLDPGVTNPFNQVSSHPVRLPPKPSTNNKPTNNMFSSQSTGGKGRRLPTHSRRKQNHAAVSDKLETKPKFQNPNLKKPPQTGETGSQTPCTSNVVLLSSARAPKSAKRQTATPDTMFDVEAEDRYWDSLSIRKTFSKT